MSMKPSHALRANLLLALPLWCGQALAFPALKDEPLQPLMAAASAEYQRYMAHPVALAAPKDCEELKNEIEVKIQANAVPSYTLEIVSKEEAEKHDIAMVVGTCDNGTKAIIYQKNDR